MSLERHHPECRTVDYLPDHTMPCCICPVSGPNRLDCPWALWNEAGRSDPKDAIPLGTTGPLPKKPGPQKAITV